MAQEKPGGLARYEQLAAEEIIRHNSQLMDFDINRQYKYDIERNFPVKYLRYHR